MELLATSPMKPHQKWPNQSGCLLPDIITSPEQRGSRVRQFGARGTPSRPLSRVSLYGPTPRNPREEVGVLPPIILS